MKRSNHVALLCTIGLVLAGCQQTKQLSEMHDATVEMNQTTKKMNENVRQTNEHVANTQNSIQSTNKSLGEMESLTRTLADKMDTLPEVSRKTDELKSITSGLCQGSRQALAEQSRGPLLDGLSFTAVTPADKIEHAAKYFKAFEFQAWGICGTLELSEREILMQSAAHEFMFAAQRYLTDRAIPQTLTDVKMNQDGRTVQDKDNKDANFNSLAITLHMMNHLQELVLAKNKKDVADSGGKVAVIEPVTMYGMIVESLALERRVNGGQITLENLKGYNKTILQNRGVAIRLLQARHNMLSGAFLSKFEDQITMMSKVRIALDQVKKGLGGKVEVSVDRFSVVQMDEMATYLRAAIDTREKLKAIGLQPVHDGNVRSAFAVLHPTTANKGGPTLTRARQELIAVIQAAKAQ